MPQTYVNPYNPTTPIGSALQNIATALFAGPTPRDMEAQQVKDDLNRAHAALYGEQARKAIAERLIAEQAMSERTPEAVDQSTAILHGVPAANVKALRSYSSGAVPMPPVMPGGVDPRAIARTLFAQNLALRDKNSTATEVTGAMKSLTNEQRIADMIYGNLNPATVGTAEAAASGKPLFHFSDKGTGQSFTGEYRPTALGDASLRTEVAHEAQRKAQEKQALAAAGASGAHARLFGAQEQEVRSGAAHPPEYVIKKDAQGNDMIGNDGKPVLEIVPRRDAIGRTPGAKPVDRADKTAVRKPLTSTQQKTLAGAIDAMEKESGAPFRVDTRKQLVSAATLAATDPNSEFYQDPVGALDAAISELSGGKGVTRSREGLPGDWIIPSPVLSVGGKGPTAAGTVKPPAAPATAAPAGGGALPPEARTRLREGVVTTFANGQRWMLQGGTPVQVQ